MYKFSIIAACLQLAVGAVALGRRVKKKGGKSSLLYVNQEHGEDLWERFSWRRGGGGALGSTSQAER